MAEKEINNKIQEIFKKHKELSDDPNFYSWKITEEMYCKLEWVIEAIDGSEELEEHTNILLEIKELMQDLQTIEEKP